MKKKILMVDDEHGIVAIVREYFELFGYEVMVAYSGRDAMNQLRQMPDLILLDINMPDMDGLTVCEKIREHVTCPILFLTARIETADKLRGFAAGADELGARVAAHLRRENRKQVQTSMRFFDDMVIEYTKREIEMKGKKILLSKKEFDIVELLSVNAGQVFDRERIYERVWGLEGDGNSDTIMEHIRKIRSKFAAVTTHNYIETVWGVGYKWNG